MADDRQQRGLFDSDEDMQAYLARILAPPEPQKFGYEHSFTPDVSARLNAEVQQPGGGMPQVVTPTAGFTLGPLSLDGGFRLQQSINDNGDPYTKATPTIGAGMKVPIGGGEASATLNVTPDQEKLLTAAWRRKLLGGEVGIEGMYAQPAEGLPQWTVRAGGRIPF